MTRALAAVVLLLAAACLADPVFKNAGVRLGPVTVVDCTSDGGLTCSRTASTGTANLRCTLASTVDQGCVGTGAQSFLGNKTVQGVVRGQAFGGADGGLLFNDGISGIDGGPTLSPLGYQSGAAGTGTALASFPLAVAAPTALLYDNTTTPGVWRYSNGSTWNILSHEFTVGGFLPSGVAIGATVELQRTTHQTPAYSRGLTITAMVAGTGAGNYTAEVYDITTSTQLCVTGPRACAGAASWQTSKACSGLLVAYGDQVAVRVDTSACTTSPALNVSAVFAGF